jgi:hypothetical protein
LNGRLTANATVFNRTISDLILVQTLAPSTGFGARVFNGGKLRNRGVELGAGFALAQRPDMNWVVRSTFFANRSKVLELPVPAFETAGFGTALGAFKIEEGKSATQIVGQEGAIGDANPDFQMSFSTDLTWRQWSLGMLWDWKKGGDVINLTDLLFDLFGNSEDWGQPGGGQDRFARFVGGETRPYVQDASYWKMREVSLSYELTPGTTRQLFGSLVRGARLTVSGRNLIRITDFRGIDPEVSNFGNQAISRNIDVAPFPQNRGVFFSIDVDF